MNSEISYVSDISPVTLAQGAHGSTARMVNCLHPIVAHLCVHFVKWIYIKSSTESEIDSLLSATWNTMYLSTGVGHRFQQNEIRGIWPKNWPIFELNN